MIRAAIAALALVACTSDRDVLIEGSRTPITACDAAWSRGWPGAPCEFPASCSRQSSDGCCLGFAGCQSGALVFQRSCVVVCPVPTPCSSDDDCTWGITLCGATGTCVECPRVAACPCESGFEHRIRNGCETCLCTPASQCDVGRTCDRVRAGACYAGQRCESGCQPDDLGCCANACAAPGCPGPAPLGCDSSTCSEPCPVCVTTACDCVAGAWQCTSECVGGTGSTCTYN